MGIAGPVLVFDGTEQRDTSIAHLDNQMISQSPSPRGFDAEAFAVSHQRREQLRAGRVDLRFNEVARHTAWVALRTVRRWPRMLAMHGLAQLPAMMHRMQFVDDVPAPLEDCITLTRMWADASPGDAQSVHDTILAEIVCLLSEVGILLLIYRRKLADKLRQYHEFDEENLLAANQSILILLTILLLDIESDVQRKPEDPSDAEVLVKTWDIRHKLARAGLFLNSETAHRTPSWRDWAMVEARRRTIVAQHYLEWSWSLINGYPLLTCFELGPLPAPTAAHLWQETNERRWKNAYRNHLQTWNRGLYKIHELFHIQADGPLDLRMEMWYAEGDELAMMLVAESKPPCDSRGDLGAFALIYEAVDSVLDPTGSK